MPTINPATGKPFKENINPFTNKKVGSLDAQRFQQDFITPTVAKPPGKDVAVNNATPTATTPTATTVSDTPVSDLFSGIVPTQNTKVNETKQKLVDFLNKKGNVSSNDIKQQVKDRFQQEVDALNLITAQARRKAQEQALGRTGTETAIQNRRRLLGSDFGQARKEKVTTLNNQIQTELDNQELLRRANITGRITDKQAELEKQASDNKIKALKAQADLFQQEATQKTDLLNKTATNIINSGLTPTDTQYNDIATQLGTTPAILKATVNSLIKTTPQKLITVNAGDSVFNPNTGEFVGIAPKPASKDKTKSEVRTLGDVLLEKDPTTGKWNVVANAKTIDVSSPEKAKKVQKTISQTDFALGSVDNALKLYKNASPSSIAEKARKLTGSATGATQLQNEIDSIKVNLLTLSGNPDIKKFFGPQMSDADVRLMTSANTTADAYAQKPEQLKKELERIKKGLQNFKSSIEAKTAGQTTTQTAEQFLVSGTPEAKNFSNSIDAVLTPEERASLTTEDLNTLFNDFKQSSGLTNDQSMSLKGIVKTNLKGNVQVDKSIQGRVEEANRKMIEATGKGIQVNQSFRTRAEQQALFDKLSKTGARVAEPGKSFHEKGLAIDVTNWKEAEPFLRAQGLLNNLPDDKGHFSFGEFK